MVWNCFEKRRCVCVFASTAKFGKILANRARCYCVQWLWSEKTDTILQLVPEKDRLVKVIDYDKGSFQDFDMHCDSISHVTFSPTGDKLFSVGFSDVALWKVLI
ncbi:uncharacterized protein LOC124449050 [Xenia sp. Carnegie-2017]|uniref:uncharacterized protein LOC124449050 n=1 Tax=Xenia sp. Carnegie-2017 TaxID=2897299 RepID=UPI001F043F5C|nr:uncharacterized protein LOC124449050 [Xenia sp. Carnegie-2017]